MSQPPSHLLRKRRPTKTRVHPFGVKTGLSPFSYLNICDLVLTLFANNLLLLISQFKEDLWTIVEKFGDHVFLMRDIEKDWATCQDEFLESVQHIVGKRGIVLSFSDPNANSSSSVSITGSLSSSRRHSFIDFEIDHLRREIDDMRAEADLMRRDLDAANAEAEDAKTRLVELQQAKELKQSTSPGPALGHGYFPRDLRESSESEPMLSGRREVNIKNFLCLHRFFYSSAYF